MSIAAEQARLFYEQVTLDRVVYTLMDDDKFLVFRVMDHDVVPFWSCRQKVSQIRQSQLAYTGFAIEELSLDEFFTDTLPLLTDSEMCVGINWSGARLTGYDITPEDVQRNLEALLNGDSSAP